MPSGDAPWYERLATREPPREITDPVPDRIDFTSFGPDVVGPSWGPTHGGAHFHGSKKDNDIQHDKMWRRRVKGEEQSHEKFEKAHEHLNAHGSGKSSGTSHRSWSNKKLEFLRDPVVRQALTRAKHRADAIERGDRAGAPWFQPAAFGAAAAQARTTPAESTWAARTFPPSRQMSRQMKPSTLEPLPRVPRHGGDAALDMGGTMQHTKHGWQQQGQLPRSASAMGVALQPIVAPARSHSVMGGPPPVSSWKKPPRTETPWLIRNSRPKRSWDTPIPGFPGGQYMEAKSRWISYSNTGRGFIVTSKAMNDTGALKRADGAMAMSAFDGFKD